MPVLDVEEVLDWPLLTKLPLGPAYLAGFRHALEILERLEVIEQVGVPAHDQLAVAAVAARPAREPGRHHLLGKLVERRLRRLAKMDGMETKCGLALFHGSSKTI